MKVVLFGSAVAEIVTVTNITRKNKISWLGWVHSRAHWYWIFVFISIFISLFSDKQIQILKTLETWELWKYRVVPAEHAAILWNITHISGLFFTFEKEHMKENFNTSDKTRIKLEEILSLIWCLGRTIESIKVYSVIAFFYLRFWQQYIVISSSCKWWY